MMQKALGLTVNSIYNDKGMPVDSRQDIWEDSTLQRMACKWRSRRGGAALSDLGLSIAVSGLLTQQESLNVTSQNIANASTSGYSRETAEVVANPPMPGPPCRDAVSAGQFGTGVNVEASPAPATNSWTPSTGSKTCCKAMAAAERCLEPGGDDLWRYEQHHRPEHRSGQLLAGLGHSQPEPRGPARAHHGGGNGNHAGGRPAEHNGQLTALQDNLNTASAATSAISTTTCSRSLPSTPRSRRQPLPACLPTTCSIQRDNLLDDLSGYVNVKTVVNPDNSVTLTVGGATVVQGPAVTQLTATPTPAGITRWGSARATDRATIGRSLGGALYGLQQARDVDVQGYITSLNPLTSTVANAVNSQHEGGYGLDGTTGIPFFVNDSITNPWSTNNITAANLAVNPEIVNNPQKIAASSGVTQATTTTQGVAPPEAVPVPPRWRRSLSEAALQWPERCR